MHTYQKGDVILTKGQKREGVFQISHGSCRIEVTDAAGSTSVVGKMKMDEVCSLCLSRQPRWLLRLLLVCWWLCRLLERSA
jgi:CRP-like cAMP-binding protein